MKKYKITIETENDAFHPDPWTEVQRILERIIDVNNQHGVSEGTLWDINGNKVGAVEIK